MCSVLSGARKSDKPYFLSLSLSLIIDACVRVLLFVRECEKRKKADSRQHVIDNQTFRDHFDTRVSHSKDSSLDTYIPYTI